ncbi:hypothetical protein AAEX28_05410 [Lentisphaerota bacterium WC36G]|nr:hypothetical protein LJT99_08265 [Lentisphaerae bacterium WC36]
MKNEPQHRKEKLLEDHKKKLIRQLKADAKKLEADDLNCLLKKRANKKIVVDKLIKAGDTIEHKMKLLWPMLVDYSQGNFTTIEWKVVSLMISCFNFLIDSDYINVEDLAELNEFDEAIAINLVLKTAHKDIGEYQIWKKEHTKK